MGLRKNGGSSIQITSANVINNTNYGITSVSGYTTSSGGNGTISYTINNVTPTTFDVVAAATVNTGGARATNTFATLTWTVIG